MEFIIEFPFGLNIHLGVEGDAGSIGYRFYFRDGRLRKGSSLGIGGSFTIGFSLRGECDD